MTPFLDVYEAQINFTGAIAHMNLRYIHTHKKE